MDGDEVVKEINIDINRGLNPIDISDLPRGLFDIKLINNGLQEEKLYLLLCILGLLSVLALPSLLERCIYSYSLLDCWGQKPPLEYLP